MFIPTKQQKQMKSEAQRNSKIRESLTRNAKADLGRPVGAGEHKSSGHREQQYYTRLWSRDSTYKSVDTATEKEAGVNSYFPKVPCYILSFIFPGLCIVSA